LTDIGIPAPSDESKQAMPWQTGLASLDAAACCASFKIYSIKFHAEILAWISNRQQFNKYHICPERCHGINSDGTAAGKICSLTTRLEVIDLETNRVSTKRRKLGLAIVQNVEQQAGLELISSVGIGKTVDKTLDSHFFRGKSNRRHDEPPRRQMGLGSLAVPAADSTGFAPRFVSSCQQLIGNARSGKTCDKPSKSSVTYFADP
jgi:hypothetical protein